MPEQGNFSLRTGKNKKIPPPFFLFIFCFQHVEQKRLSRNREITGKEQGKSDRRVPESV
jgi:hypothetical protein